jgi:CheY-like chemotaxis protein
MRVLVIDDDSVIGSLVRVILTREGYDVTVTEGGVEGLRAAGEAEPDLVLVDSTMPGMTGAEVVEALAADPATATVPVVVMSADWTTVDGGLRKPFTPTELVDLVRRRLPS